MPNEFEILARFLDRYAGEVEGRELPEPPAEIRGKLRELALGRVAEPERTELFALLRRNPAWIERLADEVKSLRTGSAGSAS